MNWTGGSLQRTKKANTGVLQQQKAYFAKVRTQLQNTTDSPVAPFQPSYLRNNDDSGLWAITPFGSGSVRHTGHAAKRPNERTQRKPTPDKRRTTTNHDETMPYEELRMSPLCRSSLNSKAQIRIHKGSSDVCDKKRKAPGMDMDLQLLEANRKRLLTQQDWVGIDPSKPVSLRFPSSREKSKVGKRRRTTRGRGAAPRRKDNDEFGDGYLHLPNNDSAHTVGRSGPHQHANDVRIWIGTDAMTNTYSTHLDPYTHSRASSEPMLFDEKDPLAQQRSEKSPVNLQLHAATTASEQARITCRAPSTGEQPRGYSFARRNVASPSRGASEQESIIGNQLGLQYQPATMTSRRNGSPSHGFRLTHHVDGGERALRFALSGSSSTAGSHGCAASDNHHIGETRAFCDADSGLPSRMEHVHQAKINREQSVNVEVSAGYAIVDEGPWKTYLAISDGSSHSDTAIQPRSSFLHDYPTKRHSNKAATNWSHQATHGQGDQSRVSSSSISASLPCLKRGVGEPISARPSGVTIIRRERRASSAWQSLDEDEKNWRLFVFQSEDNLSLPGMQDHARNKSSLISNCSGNASSRYRPLSRAVSPFSPVAYESGSGLASDAGYEAPDAGSFAPPSRFRKASPLLFRGSVERLDRSEQGDGMLERKVSDQQWVTHASLQNKASSNLISSKMFSGTTTSRSLEQDAFTPEPTRSSRRRLSRNFKGSSSGCDIPTSNYGTLHLVDPNKR